MGVGEHFLCNVFSLVYTMYTFTNDTCFKLADIRGNYPPEFIDNTSASLLHAYPPHIERNPYTLTYHGHSSIVLIYMGLTSAVRLPYPYYI